MDHLPSPCVKNETPNEENKDDDLRNRGEYSLQKEMMNMDIKICRNDLYSYFDNDYFYLEVLADYSPTASFDPSTENSLDEDSEELRRAMKKATQHKEMGPEYLHLRNVNQGVYNISHCEIIL